MRSKSGWMYPIRLVAVAEVHHGGSIAHRGDNRPSPTVTLDETPFETPTPTFNSDIDGDGEVDASDLLELLRNWKRGNGTSKGRVR